ncbi:MAG TPA: fumarylacetoacetate hydrolase family protein [Candidatus Limnocylindrales bacterium]
MRYATFSDSDRPLEARVGVVLDDGRVLDLAAVAPDEAAFASMADLIAAGDAVRSRIEREVARVDQNGTEAAAVLSADAVRLRAPIVPRKNVFCVGMNYRSHVEDNARALGFTPEIGPVPLFFTKPTTAVVGPDDPVLLDERLTAKLDYEVELAIVIARGGTWIDEAEALDHVFGYTIVNDVSARDLQWRTSQMFYGKGLDSYCPLGPWIVDAGSLPGGPSGPALEVTCRVNGELRQRDSTANLLFPVARVIAELSKGITLEAGDVIATGTPGGCGYQLDPPRFLAAGDRVECEIEGIGTLANPVVAWSEVHGREAAVAGTAR